MRSLVVLLLLARVASADAPHTVALAPLSTLGAEASGAASKKLTADLEGALGAVAGTKVVTASSVGDAIKKAKKPHLKACDGDAGCLAEVGKLAGADAIVYGEVGGLGDVQIVYLELIDVPTGKVARSTTLQLGAPAGAGQGEDTQGGARGAAVRLLAPEKFLGHLAVTVDTTGATIYVDGKRVGKSPAPPVELAVGTHALRVTHPEYRDYVRFVDVAYADKPTDVQVGLQQFPIVERDLESTEGGATRVEYVHYVGAPTPWYRRWYVIAAFGAVVAVGTGIAVDAASSGPGADHERTINPPPQ
ncbi:MAG TPA: PEGA domain-containing protein [Kofleriaceae bacterium]|nr:PEGA domain-containing protein [Kofleriaceae bacterium]